MAIEMGKKYRTRDGRDVRILCVDRTGELPVVGLMPVVGLVGGKEDVLSWTIDGLWALSDNPNDLIEIPPYSDIEIDTPGWARDVDKNSPDHEWTEAHFARVGGNGKPICFAFGRTSHTTQATFEWDEFTTTKPEGAP